MGCQQTPVPFFTFDNDVTLPFTDVRIDVIHVKTVLRGSNVCSLIHYVVAKAVRL